VTFLSVAALVLGILGVVWGVRCYVELWRWARQCQNAYIVIAHKQKVKLQAPLIEWLTWCNQLDKDEASKGRVVYRLSNASVAIARPDRDATKAGRSFVRSLKRIRNARKVRKMPVR
jgi:hypothetical protein